MTTLFLAQMCICAFFDYIKIIVSPGYNSHLDPSVAVEFSVAAMRLGHSLVPDGVVLRHNNCSAVNPLSADYGGSAGEPALRICNSFWQLQVCQ